MTVFVNVIIVLDCNSWWTYSRDRSFLQTTFMGCFEREEERTGDIIDNTFHGWSRHFSW